MRIFKGIAGAPGISAAGVVWFEKTGRRDGNISIDEALEIAREKVAALAKKAAAELGDEAAKIFEAYDMLLSDPMLTEPIKAAADGGVPGEEAVRDTCSQMAKILEAKDNEYLRQRAEDIRYVGEILVDALGRGGDFDFPQDGKKYILAAAELSPTDTLALDVTRLAGLICERGGATSHTVILAKSLGIPAVVGAKGVRDAGGVREAYLDGYTGTLIADAEGEEKKKYERLLCEERAMAEQLCEIQKKDAYTKDGERIAVAVNIGKPADLKDADGISYDGVGLFRSEFLYSEAKSKPTKDKQIAAYKKAMDIAAPNAVTVRTLDIGGDKRLDYLDMPEEENPFLGKRGIRLCLDNRGLFEEQLETILIAGASREVKIMLPMVTAVGEIEQAREILNGVRARLEAEGKQFCERVLLGIMIETPASAVMAEVFARHCDFFSIGTNDLVQYMTAADRGNAAVSALYNPMNPAVLRVINHTISAGTAAGIEVSVCGDMAANTEFCELLLGMGLKKFSVPLPMVGRIKHKISTVDIKTAKITAEKALAAGDENEVKKILEGE